MSCLAAVACCLCLVPTLGLVHRTAHEGNLRELLTAEEWQSLIGAGGSEGPGQFAVVEPVWQEDEGVVLDATSSLGRRFALTLEPSLHLLDPSFVVISRWENKSELLSQDLAEPECYYHSKGNHRAAIFLCGGMRGIITSMQDEYFVINPLPRRFHKRSAEIPHLIVKKRVPNKSNEINTFLGNVQSNKSRNKIFDHFVLKREGLMSIVNRIADSNHNYSLNNYELNKFDKGRRLVRSLKLKTDENVKVKTTSKIMLDKTTRRQRRTLLRPGMPVHVETAVFVDRDLYQHMAQNFPTDTERELMRFVLAMVNAVQLLYHDPSLGRPVSFVVKRLEILHSDPTGLIRSHDIDRFLGNFCTWQRDENPSSDADPLHWDHALMLTGLDLYVLSKNGKISSQVVGLAPVAGMCTATSSCTVNEGRHFESVYVVAHEIGHNLGMRHDGPMSENNCDPSSYLMSPTLGSGKITWSSCSRHYLQQFLRTQQSHCLMDHSEKGTHLDHSGDGALPGERFNSNQQCMLKYGRGSRHAVTQPLSDVCRDLHCTRDRYTWTSHPALEGTVCGSNKWCRSGRCVVRGLSALQALTQMVDGGWSDWSPFSDCASSCLLNDKDSLFTDSTGIMASSRFCNNPRPENGGEPCTGSDKKYKTCEASQCQNVAPTSMRDFANEVCSRAREVDKDLIGTGLQRISSDATDACTVWCYMHNGGSNSRGWTFPDGTSCRTHPARKSMFCVSGVCQNFKCRLGEGENLFVLSPEQCSQPLLYSRDKRREVAVGLWLPTTDCYFNCIAPGSGLRLVEKRLCRHCNTTTTIQLCQPQTPVCGRIKTTLEHATTVCTKYSQKVSRLSGLGMQLSASIEDPDRPCRLACQDENVAHRFYLVNGEDGWFPFGTDCSRGDTTKKAFCVSGKCLEFGSDETPLHDSGYDLPVESRLRRSLQFNSAVYISFNQSFIDSIIAAFNTTRNSEILHNDNFSIDLSDPIHVKLEAKSAENNEVDKA